MKIIFLDIDGVLNHEEFYKNRKITEDLDRDINNFCPRSVTNLNTLCTETGAKIVLSSTWRLGRNLEEIKRLLFKVGITGEVIGATPSLLGESILRGNEILKWIKDNKQLIGEDYYNFTEYVILDDDSDMLYWQRFNFLLIDRFVGLTQGSVFQAKKILNNQKILDSREL